MYNISTTIQQERVVFFMSNLENTLHMVESSRHHFLRSLLAYLFLSSLPPTGSLCEQLCINCSALHWGMLNMDRMLFFLKRKNIWTVEKNKSGCFVLISGLYHLCLHHITCVCWRWAAGGTHLNTSAQTHCVLAALMIYCRHFITHRQKSSLTAYLVRGGYRGRSEQGEKACEGL